MKTAKLVKELSGFTGQASLYKLSEPVLYDEPWDEDDPPAKETCYVIVSATTAMFSGPETYIFPSNELGEVVDWGELEGSFRGDLSHEKALSFAGFEIKGG